METEAASFSEFEKDLRDTLSRLYDPLYGPPESIWRVTGVDPSQGTRGLQPVIIRAIEELRPGVWVPADATERRFYELLVHRYVRGLTQQATAEKLGVTSRYLRGLQWKAVNALARSIWDHGAARTAAAQSKWRPREADLVRPEPPGIEGQDWATQVHDELASLESVAPGTVTDVRETIQRAAELMHKPAAERGVGLAIGPVRADVYAAIHPSALRQLLIVAIAALTQAMQSGEITIGATHENAGIQITIQGCPVEVDELGDVSLIQQVLSEQGGSFELRTEDRWVTLLMGLRAAATGDRVTVLVVEDNEDLVAFYRLYTRDTSYDIVHLKTTDGLFERVEELQPDIIVLDIMLADPEVDGWELLVHLHGSPATRSTPIVVCSVVPEEGLALTLGAIVFLAKPVRCQEFLYALDRALSRTQAGASRPAAKNGAAC